MIYFDNAATSFYKPENVKMEIIKAINNLTANPGRSAHAPSQKIAQLIYETKQAVKDFFNAKSYSVVFTKNCTEALNLAIRGCLKSGDHVIATCYEHNSVLRVLEYVKNFGVDVDIVDENMENILDGIQNKIKLNTRLIITNMVSNVTGEICNIKAVGQLCKQHNILYLVDGAQSSGHCVVDLKNSYVDMYAFAGHKGLLSITGVGGLVTKNLNILSPIIYGGTGTESQSLLQPADNEEGFEAGTIPSISILSLKAGIDFLNKNFENILKKEQKLSKYLYFELKKLNFLEIYSKSNSQNVFSFNIKNMDSSYVANELNCKFNICVRSGLHCAPLIHKKLKTIESGAVRVSIDFNNNFKEIDELIYALNCIAKN